MAYDLDQFIADCRSALSRDPGPGGREVVKENLGKLLHEPAFLAAHCGDDAKLGINVLYEDPGLGFQVLAHIMDGARVSPPHDHGTSWAIYGQATQYTDMTEWARTDDGSDGERASLKATRKYRLNPGDAGVYNEGTIHSIDYPPKARFVRVTGTDLARVPRASYDLDSGKITRLMAQRAS